METVIVQDTDQAILDVLTIVLQSEGFKVYPIVSLNDNFLDIIPKIKPQVIVLDYKLKGLDSIRQCRRIKEKFPRMPILALSCNNDIDQQHKISGFDGYMKKPFDLDHFCNTLKRYVSKKEKDLFL
ncbi:MAG: response regulator [Bacteroidota bacterium]